MNVWAVTKNKQLHVHCIWHFHESLLLPQIPKPNFEKKFDVRNAWEVGVWGREMRWSNSGILLWQVHHKSCVTYFQSCGTEGHEGDLLWLTVQCQGYACFYESTGINFQPEKRLYQLILFLVFPRHSRQYVETYHNPLLRAIYLKT